MAGRLESWAGVGDHLESMARLDKNLPTLYGPPSARGHQSFDLCFPGRPRRRAGSRSRLEGGRGPRSDSQYGVHASGGELTFLPVMV